MPDPAWGVKRLCPNCGTRFYDLTNDPTRCPACQAEHSLDSLTLKRARPDRMDAKLAAAAVRAHGEEIEDEDILEPGEEIGVGEELLEEDEDEGTVPLEDLGDRPAEEPEV